MLKRTLPFSKASARWWDGTPVRESYLGKGRVNTGMRASRPSQHRSRSRTSFPALPPSTHPPKATSSSQKHGENPALHVAEGISPKQRPRHGGEGAWPRFPPCSPSPFFGAGWEKLHQPVEEDPQAFAGGEEAAVEEVELVVILHEELEPGLVPAGGAHRLRGRERRKRHVRRGERRRGKDEI